MHTEHDSLLAGVLDQPDDVARRLVLADWLEENGQAERAALVREPFGVSRAPIRPRASQCLAAAEMVRRSLGLSAQDRLGILEGPELRAGATLTTVLGGKPWFLQGREGVVRVVLRHGFVTELGCSQGLLLRTAPVLFRNHPIRDVRLMAVRPYAGMIGGAPAYFCWRRGPDDVLAHQAAHEIAGPIFNQLDSQGAEGNDWRAYLSAVDAFAALSVACVRYGRKRAAEALATA